MIQQIKVSIIIPVYNSEAYLAESIESVLNQSYSNYELILVNDGSTDRCQEICNGYEKLDSRIKVFHKTNGGEADARNYGLRNSTGEYICFLDSDDLYDSQFIMKMISKADTEILPVCNLFRINEHSKKITSPSYVLKKPLTRNMMSCWRCMFSRKIIEENRICFTKGRRTGADQEFTFKYLLLVHDVVEVKDAIYYYRKHNDSITYCVSYSRFDAIDAMKSTVDYSHDHGTLEQQKDYERDLLNYASLSLMETYIMNLLTSGEPWKNILKYMEEKGYSKIIENALASKEHYNSFFYQMWNISPELSLRVYSARKAIGRTLRKYKIRS